MKHCKVIEFLKGKTIASIEYGIDFERFVIESITFEDGTILELEGSCDYATIAWVEKKDGTVLDIEKVYDND